VFPGADIRFDLFVRRIEQPHNGIAVPVEQPADDVHGNLHTGLEPHGFFTPERTVDKILLPFEMPRRPVEAVGEELRGQRIGFRVRESIIGVDHGFPDVGVHDAVDEVDILVVEVIRGMGDENGLEGRRFAPGDHERIERSPGETVHPHLAVRPLFLGELVDDFHAV